MEIVKQKLPCGFTVIPIVVNGLPPNKKVHEIATRTLPLLRKDSATDKLAYNYTMKGLKLPKMAIFSVLWDYNKDQPVLVTGAQRMSDNTCRLFSRFWLFTNYRTDQTNQKFDQLDDFQVDLWHMEHLKEKYPFFFWSREKGNRFFKRIKEKRPDVFHNWHVHDDLVELVWKDNWQGLLYTGPSKYIDELRFDGD